MALSSRQNWRQNPRVACLTTLVAVFLCGGVVGAVVFDFAAHKSAARAPFWTDAGKSIYLERVTRDLDLTPAQTEQMETILDDFAKYYRTVLSDGKSRIFQILNEEQKRKFEKVLQGQAR